MLAHFQQCFKKNGVRSAKSTGGDGKNLREHVQSAAVQGSEAEVGIAHIQPSGHWWSVEGNLLSPSRTLTIFGDCCSQKDVRVLL